MTDDEIRGLVRSKLADGTLPREQPVILMPAVPGSSTHIMMHAGAALPYPCTVCSGQPTQFFYTDARLAFDERCHRIWREEADKLW